eukprot:g11278.t1
MAVGDHDLHDIIPHTGIVQGVAGQTESSRKGTINVQTPHGSRKINNVWIVEKGKYSLAAVSVLAKHLKLNLLFDDIGVYTLKRFPNGKYEISQRIGGLYNGLYYVYEDFILNKQSSKLKKFKEFTAKRHLQYNRKPEPEYYTGNTPVLYAHRMNSYTPAKEELLVHFRLGHPCQRYMIEMIRQKTLRGIEKLSISRVRECIGKGTSCVCIGCIAKMNRQPRSNRTRGANRNNDKDKEDEDQKHYEALRKQQDLNCTVATDTFGPFYENYYGIKYGQIFVHLASRKVWIIGMMRKAHFPTALQQFLDTYRTTYPDKDPPEICRSRHVATFSTNTDYSIRIVRSDRAPEFSSKEAEAIYKEYGIKHLKTVAHSSWENGFAERAIQTVNKIASAQLVHAKFTPPEYQRLYWQSLRHAVDVYNLLPHSGLQYLSPEEKWTNVKPHIDQLRVFGATAFEYLDATRRPDGKRARRFRLGIYLGKEPTIDPRNPAMRLYIPHRNQIFVRKSVILDETLSHSETRLSRLRNGAHYVNFTQNEHNKVVIPSLPPFFDGVDNLYESNWSKNGETRVYKPTTTIVADEEPYTEINEERKEHIARQRANANLKQKFERPHTRSQGPVKNIVLLAHKINHTKRDKIEFVEMDTHETTVTLRVDYLWAAKATQHKDFKIKLKQFDNPTIAEAMLRKDWPLWEKAIQKEFEQLKARGTWEHVDGSLVKKRPLGTKLVLKIKRDARTNEIEKYKARLTVQGFRQVQGYDYTKTTSPVTVYATFLFLIAHATCHGRKLKTMDFAGAFLFPYLSEEIYMKLPQFYKAKKGTILKLKKSLYGLKQASREWYLALSKALIMVGFEQAQPELDSCLFYHKELDIYLCVHVDDCFMSYTSEENVTKLVDRLEEMNFEFSVVEELRKGLGLSIDRDDKGVTISQPQYVDFIKNEFRDDLDAQKGACKTPLQQWYDSTQEGEDLFDMNKYRKLLGCLGHLARMTRPDILQAVFHLAQFSHKPSTKHWQGLSRVVHYLNQTKLNGIRFEKNCETRWKFYVDADWAGDPSTRRSTTGYLIRYQNGPLICVSRRQKCVTLSSTEAEYCAFTDAAKDIIWSKRLAEFFNEEFPRPATLMNDNVTAQNLANGEMTLNRMKHVGELKKHAGVRFHWIKELIEDGIIELKHVSSENNLSDLFTKPLKRVIHNRLSDKVMNNGIAKEETPSGMEARICLVPRPNSTIEAEITNLVIRIGA